MPEGDTVWRTAQRLDQALSGQAAHASATFGFLAWPRLDLVGRVVDETVSRGKHLLTRLGDVTVHTHLKMEGSWHIYRPGSAWRSPAIPGTARPRPTTPGRPSASGSAPSRWLRERRGFASSGTSDLTSWAPTGTSTRRCAGCSAARDATIGEALLDQRNLAGLGTLYRAETLFLTGVSPPYRPVGRSGRIARGSSTEMAQAR